jgi:hypothetical protein
MSTDTPTAPSAPDEHLVATIMPVSEQIGTHVMTAFQQPGAVAVLTTVVPGVDADRVVSVALTDAQMDEVRELLSLMQEDEPEALKSRSCIGFQCRIET